MRSRSLGLLVATTTAVASIGGVLPAGAADNGAGGITPIERSADPLPTHEQATSVTLVTGDVVTYLSRSGADDSVLITHQRPGIRYQTYQWQHQWFVMPSDAEQPVATGAVDQALFDVSYLAHNGYDDNSRTSIPVLMRYGTPDRAQSAAAALPAATVTRALPAVSSMALDVSKSGATLLWRSVTGQQARVGVGSAGKLWLDRVYHADLAQSVSQVGAPQAWSMGYDGTGARVAILDTGVDQTHPDLTGKVVAAQSFIATEPDVLDHFGHGTHVASIVAGSGAASDGVEKGVAPGAQLVVGKVLSRKGIGYESDIIAGMTWAASRAKVVNMSLSGAQVPGQDPMVDAVQELTASTGALFVVAAGNTGPNMDTLGTCPPHLMR